MDYSFASALYDCVSLNVATKFIKTRDSAVESLQNLSIVSALLLTMVSLGDRNGSVGDGLSRFVETESAEHIYTSLCVIALTGFFLSTIASACVLVYSGFIIGDAEFLAYVSETTYLWKITLGTFFIALFSDVLSQLWLSASLLGPTTALSLVGPGIAVLVVVLYGFAHSAQTLNRIQAAGLKEADSAESRGFMPLADESLVS